MIKSGKPPVNFRVIPQLEQKEHEENHNINVHIIFTAQIYRRICTF